LCLALPALAGPALAEPLKPTCHAFSDLDTTYSELAADPANWNCGSMHWRGRQPAAWLRFDATGWQDRAPPRVLITRATKFDKISIFGIMADGTVHAIGHDPEDVSPKAGGATFSAPLPPVTDDTVAVVVRVIKPWNAAILSEAYLSADPQAGEWPIALLAVVGMAVGLLLAPLIFDVALFYVLRQRFVLWHAGMVVGMLGHMVCFTGLIILFVDLDVVILAKLSGITAVIAVASAGAFTAGFMEPGKLSPMVRKGLLLSSAIVLAGPGVITLHPPFLEYTSHQYFYLGFLPALVAQIAAMTQALRRNSRAVKFQIAAWSPIILCLVERIARGTGLYSAPPFADEILYITLVTEVVISAVGVADRMIALRDQRDNALKEARVLEKLAERDPLTGLLNRRAIEPRFHELCAQGFNTFALLDLDHFKSVNDAHGHAVGDEVLRATARGLAPDEDTLVMRLGGEEFLLLLRGRRARERAEQRRKMLPRHIAEQAPDLDRLVTASMGLVEGTSETMAGSSFHDVYARADKLLYEAKQAGRNRTIGEKLTVFSPRGRDRHKADHRTGSRRKVA